MGITTRGGVARILEYNKNDGLISEIESNKRIIIILQIFAFIFSIILQFIVLLIFGTIYDGTKTFLLVDDRLTPNLNYYVQSISLNGSVRLLPILQTTNSSTGCVREEFAFRFLKILSLYWGYIDMCLH